MTDGMLPEGYRVESNVDPVEDLRSLVALRVETKNPEVIGVIYQEIAEVVQSHPDIDRFYLEERLSTLALSIPIRKRRIFIVTDWLLDNWPYELPAEPPVQ